MISKFLVGHCLTIPYMVRHCLDLSGKCHCYFEHCSRTCVSNSSFPMYVISALSEPVTIHMHACTWLTVVWWCPYILGFSSAGATKLDLTVNRKSFLANWT